MPATNELTKEPLRDNIKDMSKPTRTSKSFTVDRLILDYIQRTRSRRSRSERLNQLLRRAILEEQYEALEREAAAFFASVRSDRKEARAFAAVGRLTIARVEE